VRNFRHGLIGAAILALASAPTAVNASTTFTAAESFGTWNLTLSDAFGTGTFGTVTVTDFGLAVADISVNVAPAYLTDTGNGHFIFTFSLAGGGTVDTLTISNTNFTYGGPGNYKNSPFQFFTSEISSSCNGGGACTSTNGQVFNFHVTNFAGLITATDLYNGYSVLFAVDTYRPDCGFTECTGAVGAIGATLSPPSFVTPLPSALPLFATGLGALGLFGWRRKRKTQPAAT